MEFRIYKYFYARILTIGLVICMIFGLFGCGSNRETPEQAAAEYLERTYHKKFAVDALTKKDGGSFKSEEYSGFAYESGERTSQFKVWVSADKKTVNDAYYVVSLLPGIHNWVQDTADDIWEHAKTTVIVEPLRYHSTADYGADDFRSFYEKESVENTIYLVLDKEEFSMERYCEFDTNISKLMNGYVRIYLSDKDQVESADFEEILDSTPDYSIYIGAPLSVIEENFAGTGGN